MNPLYQECADSGDQHALDLLAQINASQQRQAHNMCGFLRVLQPVTATGADHDYARAFELEAAITDSNEGEK